MTLKKLLCYKKKIKWQPRIFTFVFNESFNSLNNSQEISILRRKMFEKSLIKPENLEDLRQRIVNEVRRITVEIIENVQNEFYYRLGYCQDVQRQHFEHLL
jgi:hypothetical protein